jgi:hypothetical protein
MKDKYFQIGSIKARFRKLAVFSWHNVHRFGISSLASILKASKKSFKWLTHLNWIKLLKAIKLVIEILKNIRSLLFCDQTVHFVQGAG